MSFKHLKIEWHISYYLTVFSFYFDNIVSEDLGYSNMYSNSNVSTSVSS